MGGMTRLLLLLWAGVTVSTAMDLHKRIVKGRECGNNERHHHVKLTSNVGHYCGGTLISDRWILTAKHCNNTMTAHFGLHPRTGQNIPPMEITDPPVTFDPNHDIMLLKLPEAVNPKDVQPVALPNDCNNAPKKGDTVQIAGYGPTADNTMRRSNTLQCGNTKVVDCILVNNPQYEFCGDTNTVRQKGGDSGGGVLFRNQIHGVISDEIMFLKVCGYLKWITDTMNKP